MRLGLLTGPEPWQGPLAPPPGLHIQTCLGSLGHTTTPRGAPRGGPLPGSRPTYVQHSSGTHTFNCSNSGTSAQRQLGCAWGMHSMQQCTVPTTYVKAMSVSTHTGRTRTIGNSCICMAQQVCGDLCCVTAWRGRPAAHVERRPWLPEVPGPTTGFGPWAMDACMDRSREQEGAGRLPMVHWRAPPRLPLPPRLLAPVNPHTTPTLLLLLLLLHHSVCCSRVGCHRAAPTCS